MTRNLTHVIILRGDGTHQHDVFAVFEYVCKPFISEFAKYECVFSIEYKFCVCVCVLSAQTLTHADLISQVPQHLTPPHLPPHPPPRPSFKDHSGAECDRFMRCLNVCVGVCLCARVCVCEIEVLIRSMVTETHTHTPCQ